MNSYYSGVRAIAVALTKNILKSRFNMNGQEVGNALYTLQNMNSEDDGISDLIIAIKKS